MVEIINLRLKRKAKLRDDKATAAEQSRLDHGVSKHQKLVAERLKGDAARKLDLLKLENVKEFHLTQEVKP